MQQAPRQSDCRILLVEDDEPNAIYATEALKLFGCEVTRANDGSEAVSLCGTERFALIFMDYRMSRMNGLEATVLIRKAELAEGQSPIPIIGLTACAMEWERKACLQSGMVDILLKPFRMAELQNMLAKWGGFTASERVAPRRHWVPHSADPMHPSTAPGLGVTP